MSHFLHLPHVLIGWSIGCWDTVVLTGEEGTEILALPLLYDSKQVTKLLG